MEEMNNSNIVSVKGIHKTYDTGQVKVHALRGLDLEIKEGEMMAIMGPSGCGKTTLLNCLSGLDEVDEGEIIVKGNRIPKMSDKERTRFRAEQMGFVFQAFNLLPVLSVVENVELPLLLSGHSQKEARKRALEVLELVNLSDQALKRPAELSGGQQQRVAVSRALVNNPVIVWGDEPTGNLDSETAMEIMEVLRRLNKENGQTFVLVTHALEVGEATDRIVRMRDGVIECDGAESQDACLENSM